VDVNKSAVTAMVWYLQVNITISLRGCKRVKSITYSNALAQGVHW